MKNHTSQAQAFSLLTAAAPSLLCIVFGANAVAIKVSLTGLGPFTSAGLRFSIAAVAIALWAFFTRRPFKIRKKQLGHLVIIGMIFSVQLSLIHLGFSLTTASRGALLTSIQPFFVLLMAHFFLPGDFITLRKTLGILLGFAGVFLVFQGKEDLLSGTLTGDFIIIGSASVWAANTVYIKKVIDDFRSFHLVLYPMIIAVPIFFIEGVLWDYPMVVAVNRDVIISMLYQSLVAAAFGYVSWNYLLSRYGATALHSFVFLMPVSGVFFGGLLLGEPITANILLALILIMTGIFVVHYNTTKGNGLFSRFLQ